MKEGRRIAFDYGSVRIGVGLSDYSGIIATPLKFLVNGENTFEEIKKLLENENPIYVVVGIPKHLSGTPGTKDSEVMVFISKLKNITELPIYGIDERLSTVNAAAKLREIGRDSKSAKELIDSAAAVGILEVAMEHERAGGLDKCAL